MNPLSKVHLTLGVFGLLLFLLSGAYMKFVAHPGTLSDRAHLMFVSRHIYCLANALVHLSLAAYITPLATRNGRAAQWTGSALLAVSGLLLMSAFVVEAIGGRSRTFASSFGLYLLFAGVLLHLAPALWSARRRKQ